MKIILFSTFLASIIIIKCVVASDAPIKIHKVIKHESLSSIAQKYYGSIDCLSTILQANRSIKNPEKLEVGDVIKIPPRSDCPNSIEQLPKKDFVLFYKNKEKYHDRPVNIERSKDPKKPTVRYAIRVSSHPTRKEAVYKQLELDSLKIKTVIAQGMVGDQQWFHLQIGSYSSSQAALSAAKKMDLKSFVKNYSIAKVNK